MSKLTWFEALQCEGAEQMKYLRALMEELQIMTYRPAQFLLPEENETVKMDLHQQCCIQEEERTVCVYLPSGGNVELKLDLAGYKEKAFLWWYSPRDGKFYTAEGIETDQAEKTCLNTGKLQVNAPESGEEKDWILIVQTEEREQPIQDKVYFDKEKEGQLKKVFVW